jgi:hypothetical protein
MRKSWNEADNVIIRQEVGRKTDEELAEMLTHLKGYEITVAALRKQRRAIGIKKMSGRGKIGVVGALEYRPSAIAYISANEVSATSGVRHAN